MEIEIIKTEKSRISETDFNNLQFGNIFSDHIIVMDYYDEKWQKPKIKPYGPMEIYPANCYLHYGQAVFEGLKAFRTKSGKINIFRVDMHYKRLNSSCERYVYQKWIMILLLSL